VKQTTRDSLIVVAVLLGIVGATCALVYYPQRRTLQDLRAQVEQEKTRLLDSAAKTAVVPTMLREVQGMKKRYGNFDQPLSKKKEMGGFLKEISSDLAQENLDNPTIEPGTPRRAALFHTLPIVLRFEGPYLSLASFLKRLGQMERLAQVEKLSISSRPSETLDGTRKKLSVEMLLNIYFTES